MSSNAEVGISLYQELGKLWMKAPLVKKHNAKFLSSNAEFGISLYQELGKIVDESPPCQVGCDVYLKTKVALRKHKAKFSALASQNLHGGHSNWENVGAGSARPKFSDSGDEESQSRPGGNFNLRTVGASLALAVIFLSWLTSSYPVHPFQYWNKGEVIDPKPAWKDSFQKELFHLEKPEMSDEDFSAILAATKKWLDGGAKPTVLTLAGHGAEKFGLTLLESLNKFVGNTADVRIQAQRDDTRQQLDDKVSEGLRSVNKPAVLVTNIQDLKWDSPMFIYRYADDDHHLIDNALLILTVDHKIDGKCSRGIRKLLQTSWLTTEDTEMEEREIIEPAISRIVSFVACF